MNRTAIRLGLLFLVSFLLTTTGILLGTNQWSCWHWSKNTITARSAASGYWGTIISSELSQWDDAGTCVGFSGGSEITGDADFYGNTGWLGLARILDYDAGKCEILKAEALMNRTYLDGASYDETDDRHVTCQELGHDLGLDHRKGPRNQTCMNDMFLGFPDYDQHDADTLASITGGCSTGGGGGDDSGGDKEKGRKKCTDRIDNDGDSLIDEDDPDCQ